MTDAGALTFGPLQAKDLLAIERQASQMIELGREGDLSEAEAAALARWPMAWAAKAGGQVVACFGIAERFAGAHGEGWCVLAEGIGARHLQLTREVRACLEGSGLQRVDILVRCADIEPLALEFPDFDPWQLVQAATARPTPELRWARLLGFRPAHVLRRFGANSECCLLCEWLAPPDKEIG